MAGRSYEEQRIAELAYAEEYRRRLRRERAGAGAGQDMTSDEILAARAAADTESAAIVEREREAARLRRERSEAILGRTAPPISEDEWTPVATRRGDNTPTDTEGVGTGVDFEPIVRVDAPLTESTPVMDTGTAAPTDTEAATASPTYRVVLEGDISSHRIEIGGMQFTTEGGVIEPVTKRRPAPVESAPRDAATPVTEPKAASATADRPTTGVENTDDTAHASQRATATATDIPAGHAGMARRRGVIYADYGAMPGGTAVPFAMHATDATGVDDEVIMSAPRDPLGLADRPVSRATTTPDNLDTPPTVSGADGRGTPTSGGFTAQPIHRDIDGDIGYVGPFDNVEPEYEYDGGITRRGRSTDIPDPRALEEDEYGRILADDRRRRRTDGTPRTSDGAGLGGAETHVPYDGSVVDEPDGVGRAPTVDPRALEEEEYRRILGGDGRIPDDGMPTPSVGIDGARPYVPYDGRVVDDPEGVGRAPVIDPTMLEEEDMLAFAGRYGDGRTTDEPTATPSGIDFVAGYDMPGEERGADIPHTYAPYMAPVIDDGVDDTARLDRAAVIDRAAERREMERDMTEFIRSTRERERERREREAGRGREPAVTEPGMGEGSLVFDKRALTRLTKRYAARDLDLIEARITSRIAALETRREATDMTFSEPDRAEKRDRRKLLYDLKVEGKRLTRAKKLEAADNARYHSIVLTDLARIKLPRSASSERLIALRERAMALLARRDELNERLAELYRGAKGHAKGRGVAARDAAARKGRIAEHKKQQRLEHRMRRMKVAYDYRKRLEELMDEMVRGMGEIKLYEYILRHERPHGRAKREAKDKLKDAIRAYKRNKKEIERISKKAFRHAKDEKRRKKGEVVGWLALLLLLAVIGVCVWQWGTIWEFIVKNVPILGEIFGSKGGIEP